MKFINITIDKNISIHKIIPINRFIKVVVLIWLKRRILFSVSVNFREFSSCSRRYYILAFERTQWPVFTDCTLYNRTLCAVRFRRSVASWCTVCSFVAGVQWYWKRHAREKPSYIRAVYACSRTSCVTHRVDWLDTDPSAADSRIGPGRLIASDRRDKRLGRPAGGC